MIMATVINDFINALKHYVLVAFFKSVMLVNGCVYTANVKKWRKSWLVELALTR